MIGVSKVIATLSAISIAFLEDCFGGRALVSYGSDPRSKDTAGACAKALNALTFLPKTCWGIAIGEGYLRGGIRFENFSEKEAERLAIYPFAECAL